MSDYFYIHKKNPQQRLIKRISEILSCGGVIVYPTDSSYALGCLPGNKDAIARICRIRNLTAKHHFTLMCRNIKEISRYAWINNVQFKIIKRMTPGPYTFILKATKEVPSRVIHQKSKTIGIRIPDCNVVLNILDNISMALITTSLIMPEDHEPMHDPLEIKEKIGNVVDAILDSGPIPGSVTTMIDLTSDTPVVLRKGLGDFTDF